MPPPRLGTSTDARRTPPSPLLLAAAVLGACVGYEPKPLDGTALVESVAQARRAPDGDAPPTLATATEWLRTSGPTVRETVAAWRTAQARADVATPWPDPSLEFGPQAAWGSDANPAGNVTPFAALLIPIPLGDRRGAQDDLNRARAESLRIAAVLALRDEYLALRGDWATLCAARAREDVYSEVAEAAARTADVARRLVEAGSATALDTALFELERARAESAQLDAAVASADAEGTIAARTGVAAERYAGVGAELLPAPPEGVPTATELRALLARHRPDLVALRADYAVAERALRLEVEKQYPDLVLAPGFSDEPGEDKDVLKLGVGLRLPIFDRNQQAIAEATERREELRSRYEAAANRALAQVERLTRTIALTAARRRALEDDVLPRAASNLEMARRAAAAGSTDALRYLDAERSLRTLRVGLLDARLAELEAWTALERAVGHPLLAFPGEPEAPHDDPNASTDPETLGDTARTDEENAR